MFVAVLSSGCGSVFDSSLVFWQRARCTKLSRVCSMVLHVIWYLLYTLYCTNRRAPSFVCARARAPSCVCVCSGAIIVWFNNFHIHSGAIIVWFNNFHIHSTALVGEHFHPYVCLHTLPPWNRTNNEAKAWEILLRELKQISLAHTGMGGYSPSNVSGAGIRQWLGRRICDRKNCPFQSQLPVLTYFSIRSTTVLLQ